VQKYLGLWGVICYLLLGFCGVIVFRRLLVAPLSSLKQRQIILLSISTLLVLLCLCLVLYPKAQAGVIGGGSDADDALNIAANELVHGRYPYYPRTYLDNQISPMPGAVILALPFVWLSSSAYQNIFWLAVFLYLARRHLDSAAEALALFWAVLCLSPLVLQNLVTGTDYLANSIYVAAFMYWMIRSIKEGKTSTWQKVTAAVLVGIGLSSRATFIACLPLTFSALLQNAGWKPAVKYTLLTVASLGAITIPFWLWAPHAFTPLTQQTKKVAEYGSVLPHSGLIISGVTILISVALSFQRMDGRQMVWFRNCALVQAFPVLCVVALASLNSGRLNFIYSSYGMFALFFGALGFWQNAKRGSSPTVNEGSDCQLSPP